MEEEMGDGEREGKVGWRKRASSVDESRRRQRGRTTISAAQPMSAILLTADAVGGRALINTNEEAVIRGFGVKYLEAQPTGTFSRGKELPHRQPSHDI